jgi:uncharacterized protein (DUF1499 family)
VRYPITDTGSLEDGKLRLCPKSPNCVSSESDVKLSRIAPIPFSGDPSKALGTMKQTLLYMGAHVEREEGNYLWVTFRSMILRFTDDVEIHLVPEQSVLHIRSGSRVGYSDMGANRERVEHIRRHFNERLEKDNQ